MCRRIFNIIYESIESICPKESKVKIFIALVSTSLLALSFSIFSTIYVDWLISIFIMIISVLFLAPIHSILYYNLKQLNIQDESYRRKEFNKGKMYFFIGFRWVEYSKKDTYLQSLINNGITHEPGGPTRESIIIKNRKKKLSNIK